MDIIRGQHRQGDVLVERADADEAQVGEEVPRDERGRVVLAHGGATGHAHAISSRGASLREYADGRRILRVAERAFLDHEEHKPPISLPTGDHVVTRQEEYVEGDLRQVAD